MFGGPRRRPAALVLASTTAGSASSTSTTTTPLRKPVIITTTRTIVPISSSQQRKLSSVPIRPSTPVSIPSTIKSKSSLKRKEPSSHSVKSHRSAPSSSNHKKRVRSVDSSDEETEEMRAERERIAEEIIDRKRRNSGNSPGQSSSRIRDVAAEEDGNIACFESEKLVLDNRDRYVEYFNDPADPTRSIDCSIMLEYPGIGAREKFILLTPLRPDEEYDPITDLLGVIRLTLDYFLTPAQSLFYFGYTTASASTFSAFLSAPSSRAVTPSSIDSPRSTSFPRTISTTGTGGEIPTIAMLMPGVSNLMKGLEKFKAKKDGPSFLLAVTHYNTILLGLKTQGLIGLNIKTMRQVNEKIWNKLVAQVYERAVGPEIETLGQYTAFSDNVYGELLPRFMAEIFELTGLDDKGVFVDLGSGVGNCVLQAALATGAESYGYENWAQASTLAEKQVIEAESRFRRWGLKAGKMRTVQIDFCESVEVQEVLKRATVVLVNNEVFSAGLNDQLSLLFLDLPHNARVVSLKAFASSFTLSAYTLNSPLANFEQGKPLTYGKKSVSWKADGGTYYIGRVDRGKVDRWKKGEEERIRLRKKAEEEGNEV